MVFQGEEMVCIMSGAKKRSHRNVESNWDCIVADGVRYYVSKKWRDKSYKKRGIDETYALILKKIVSLQNGGA